MPFVTLKAKVKEEELRVKLEQPLLEDLKKYAEFAGGSVSAVVQEVLRKVLAKEKKDPAFLAYLEAQNASAEAAEKRKGKAVSAGA